MVQIDVLVKDIKELVNPANDAVVRGSELNAVKVSHNVWLGATGDNITFIGFEKDFEKK